MNPVLVVYLTVTLSVLNQIGLKGSKVLMALYALHFGAGPIAIGVLAATYACVPLLVAVYAGRVSDRVGVRPPMIMGSFGMGLGLAIPLLYPALPALYLGAAILGTSNIFFHVATHNLVGAMGDKQARTKNFSTFSLGSSISGFLGPVLVGWQIDNAGYANALALLAGIVLIPGALLCVYGRLVPPRGAGAKEHAAGGVKDLLANGALRNTLITSGLILTGIDLFNFYMPIHGRAIGLTASFIGIVIGMQAAAAFIVRLALPSLARRFTEKRVLTYCLLMAGLTYFLFPLLQQPVLLATVSFILGLALGCGQPLSIILTYNYSPPGRAGEALGMRLTVNKFIQIVVPLVFGSMGAAFGVFPIFWSNAALLLAGGWLNTLYDKRRQIDLADQAAAAQSESGRPPAAEDPPA
ncbi:MFS transporter [Pusillimonas noertemannii]|uniref:Putative MFS family arabinose efflux permease n=1 Tax=Pusillimonas noertemannii TaxID=305977 RepID=A0A2U1CII9_9BURK|nr:MFS transporter [Pusillimonas noertemannii]PVY60805.1 putative MFS family arabinose efflux permease [Pusillimonas noertemannii]